MDHDGADKDAAATIGGLSGSEWNDRSLLERRAKDALSGIAARHSTPPRIKVVDHPAGSVLVIGVERAPDLIPVFEAGGAPVYFVRTFDGTTALSDVVASDLLVGRRARLSIGLTLKLEEQGRGPQGISLHVTLRIQNEGLVWIEDLRAGVLFRSASCRDAGLGLAPHLAREVDADEPSCVHHLTAPHENHAWSALPPMAETGAGPTRLVVPCRAGEFAMAAYVVAKGHPPQWWQAEGTIVRAIGGLSLGPTTCRPCRGTRPMVSHRSSEG